MTPPACLSRTDDLILAQHLLVTSKARQHEAKTPRAMEHCIACLNLW